MLQDDMQQLGFSEKEIEVYLALLRSGKANPTDVANVTRINRTTVYSVTKSLLEKGAVSEDIGGKTLYLVPTPPEHLLQALAEEQAALDSRKVLAESVIKELARIPSSTQYSIPRIRFIEEGDLVVHQGVFVALQHLGHFGHNGGQVGFQGVPPKSILTEKVRLKLWA